MPEEDSKTDSISVWEALGEEYFVPRPPGMLPGALTDPHEFVNAAKIFTAARDKYRELKAVNPAAAAEDTTLRDILVEHFHTSQRSALCISGGGVRSATFSLGVLEGLARYSWKDPKQHSGQHHSHQQRDTIEPKLLAEFDFLSTVSGGGYTGGWFSSWAAREHDSARVVKMLAHKRTDKLDPEPTQLRYLRTYASFLNPKLGFTSADSWTLFATIIRNIALNWMVLLPLLAAVLVIPRVFFALVRLPVSVDVPTIVIWGMLALAFLFAAISAAYMIDDLPKAGNARRSQGQFLVFCLGALCFSACCLVLFWSWHLHSGGGTPWWGGIAYTDSSLLLGVFMAAGPAIKRRGKEVNVWWMTKGIAGLLVSGALGGFLSQRAAFFFSDFQQRSLWHPKFYTWLGLPILIGVFGIFQLVLVGVTSKYTEDEDREWWARCAAWFTIVLFGWLIATGLVLYATTLFGWSLNELLSLTGTTTVMGAVLSLLGFSPKSNSRGTEESDVKIWQMPLPGKIRELAIQMILPVFFILLIMTFAALDEAVAWRLPRWAGMIQTSALVEFTRPISHWKPNTVPLELLLLGLLALPSLVASRYVNANTFSLHAMYRSRLIRTFLGASNPEASRAAEMNPFTGFAQNDNVTMASLANIKTKKPLHVVNVALNLVKGEKLAWQQRKAESFTISPLHSGSLQVGYVPSHVYARANHKRADGTSGITLGGAITISGAAASPNMGYHSSPLLTMIMTLFNARLGAWLPNPGPAGRGFWTKEAPNYTFTPFVDEAFGLTTDTNAWVYLSDGGHFENLGLYEMVLRRCHNILVVDGGADPDYNYEDLGNAVRKIRVDLGIPIEFPYGIPISKTHEPGSKHCALGVIEYSCVDPDAPPGRLIYVKTSLNRNEPPDILNYSTENPGFPQQPTEDLWFDEAQFESYRRLGSHVIDELCGGSEVDRKILSVEEFFDAVEKKYLAIPAERKETAASFARGA